jgi:hypothetical protein
MIANRAWGWRFAPSGLGVILIADQPRALPWAILFGPVGAFSALRVLNRKNRKFVRYLSNDIRFWGLSTNGAQ